MLMLFWSSTRLLDPACLLKAQDTCYKADTVQSVCRLDPAEVERKGDRLVWSKHPEVQVTAQKHKMSKSRGNVVNPDDVVYRYGADSLRLYEMFLGPLQDTKVGTS